ncbi:unnamed protein product [Hermetia illucens]|uniref:N-acyl-aliphatic-L-amino acid amidohydrolase n=1 Tax=Hermetia illucens TaxID=343691 RepID=A0A7R8YYY5_HERIL|nr:aminoacylase-1-like [Hermetia illucens]CAD7089930.1 unnamed protein product [Hermetia illucens]
MAAWENNEEIKLFQEYLRIPSTHPDVDYEPCVEFLKRQAQNLGLPIRIYHPTDPKKPTVIITWTGTQPELPSIVLNSHMDVVPVYPEKWTHPPFGAEIDSKGRIFARGTQDMKSVGMQYLAAIRALKKEGKRFKRTIHIMFAADEEIGGKSGMAKFVPTDDFKALNVGFALDEGIASPNETFDVFYAERSIWFILFHISGNAGHGSLLHENTVGVKLRYIIDRMMDFREAEVKKLANNSSLNLGNVTTVNLTRVQGGILNNIVPPKLMVSFDVRLALDVDHQQFIKQLEKWCEEAGGGIEITYESKEPYVPPTPIDDSNIYWKAFKGSLDSLGLKSRTLIFPGATDSRYIRAAGIPAIGFSPMNNTPVLLHDNDEYIDADIYLKGIEIYKTIIPNIANA